MAFTALRLGFKHDIFLNSLLRGGRSNARQFSSVLQNSTSRVAVRPFAPRFISTSNTPSTPVDASAAIPEPVLSDVAPEATSMLANGAETVSTIVSQISPLQYGDLAAMGLAGWSPAGLARWSFEIINVSTGMPWFWTIIAGTVFWRVVCLPLTIIVTRETAKMFPLSKEIQKFNDQKQRSRFLAKRNIADTFRMPFTLGILFSVNGMSDLEQLKDSGLSMIPDLTVPDPTYMLPLAMCALGNVYLAFRLKEKNRRTDHIAPHVYSLARAGILFLAVDTALSYPSALTLSLTTTMAFSAAEAYILHQPAVRRQLSIPIIPKDLQGRMPSLVEILDVTLKSIRTVDTLANRPEKSSTRRESKRKPF